MAIYIEQTENEVLYAGGINTQKPVTISGSAGLALSGTGVLALSSTGGVAISAGSLSLTSTAGLNITGTGALDMSGTSGVVKLPTAFPNGGFALAIRTTGNTAVNLFGATTGFAGSLTSISIISQDAANGKIEVYSDQGTIIQINKGSIGAMAGSVASVGPLARSTFAAGSSLKVVSGTAFGAGDVILVATYVTV